ncbi:DUF397 domain-containing protein [Nocardiopsis nanhaiensis]
MSKDKAITAPPIAWHTSTYSANGSGQCVEAGPFRHKATAFAVRDSNNRDLGYLTFASPEWTALLASLD